DAAEAGVALASHVQPCALDLGGRARQERERDRPLRDRAFDRSDEHQRWRVIELLDEILDARARVMDRARARLRERRVALEELVAQARELDVDRLLERRARIVGEELP